MVPVERTDRIAQEENHIDPTVIPDNATSSTSKPVEMDNLSPSSATGNQYPTTASLQHTIGAEMPKENQKPAMDSSSLPTNTSEQPLAPPANAMSSTASAEVSTDLSAIGPATDKPMPSPSQTVAGPQLILTLLLHTGARHLLMINEKYLRKRNVTVTDYNPINLSVYTLKELIWRDWRDDWDPRPSSPSSIRLIHYGKMLDDKSRLTDGRFSLGDVPHVVHMTIKPQDMVDDEDARIAKGGGRGRDTSERTPRCRCVIL